MSLSFWNFDPAGSINYPLNINSYREKDASSGEGEFTENDGSAKRDLQVNWDQNVEFISDVLGYAVYVPPFAFGVTGVSRNIPDNHPDFPALWAMSASRTAISPSSVNGAASTWTLADVNTTYRAIDYFILPDDNTQPNELYRFVSRQTIPKGEALQLNLNAYSWFIQAALTGQPAPLGATPSIIVPNKQLIYIWHMIPAKTSAQTGIKNQELHPPIENTIVGLLGTYNSAIFDGFYPIGTVLFTAAECTLIPPRFNSLYHWNIKFIFEVKDHGPSLVFGEEIGVNYLYNSVQGYWDVPVITVGAGAGNRLYQPADLNTLFTISALS